MRNYFEILSSIPNRYGYIDSLTSELGSDCVSQLEAMGYIVEAPSANGNTWKLSSRASQLIESYNRKSSFADQIVDWFNVHIRKLNFNN